MNFSVKDSLVKLQNKNYGLDINNTINMIVESYDEGQIRVLSQYQGLKLDNKLIRLFFIENVGFRCLNDKNDIYGKFPICKNIEKFMNELYFTTVFWHREDVDIPEIFKATFPDEKRLFVKVRFELTALE